MKIFLKTLTIHQFRDIQPETLHFSPTYNVLLGKNGSGKTTLLNLISAVLRGDFSEYKNEDISLSYVFESEMGLLEGEVKSYPVYPLLDPMVASDAWKPADRFRLQQEFYDKMALEKIDKLKHYESLTFKSNGGDVFSFLYDNKKSCFRIKIKNDVEKEVSPQYTNNTRFLFFLAINELSWGDFLSDIIDGGILVRFDESLSFFGDIVSSEEGKKTFSIKILAEDSGFKKKWISIETNKFFVFMGVFINLKGGEDFSFSNGMDIKGVELEFLKDFQLLAGFNDSFVRFSPFERGKTKSHEYISFENPVFFFSKANGTEKNHKYLSYGQKRLLAFLFYVASNKHFIIADELVNGFHHEWIEACMEKIQDRQSFLTSQNPLLLDYLHFEDKEQAKNSFILCSSKQEEKAERFVWKQMDEQMAEAFFKAYSVGYQHVSEVLRAKGLW